jgi:hypothetical protein
MAVNEHAGRPAEPWMLVDVDRLVHGQVRRRRRTMMISRDRQPGDLRRIAESAIGHDAGDAALHQPRDEDRPRRRGARVLAAVDDQDGARRTLLDRLALRMRTIAEHGDRVQVLARRDVAQRIGLADHRLAGRVQRPHVLDELRAQSALEQRRGERRGAHRRELRARPLGQSRHRPLL